MTKSIHSTVAFMVWTIAGTASVAAWTSSVSDNLIHSCFHTNPFDSPRKKVPILCDRYRETTKLRVLSQDVSESLESEAAEEGAQRVPYVIARGDGSTGGGGLPMPQSNKSPKQEGDEDDDETEELRRPKVNAEMPQG